MSGVILVKPGAMGVKQEPPLPVAVELAEGHGAGADLAQRLSTRIREVLIVTTKIDLVPLGQLAAQRIQI